MCNVSSQHCRHPYKGKPEDIQVFYVGPLVSKEQAIDQGETRYFTGRPCVHGHIHQRLVRSNHCIRCKTLDGYQKKGTEKGKSAHKKSVAKWQQSPTGRAYMREKAARRKRTKEITALWGKDEMLNIYKNTPPGHHVDHIIPLVHPLVSGLHVPANLQYLPAKENMKKSNRFDIHEYVHVVPEF